MLVVAPVSAQTPPPDAAAATAPADAGAAGVTPPTTTATVENPYGLGALWAGGDFVSKGVLGLLAIMSLGTWYIFFTKYWEQARLMSQAKVTEKKVLDRRQSGRGHRQARQEQRVPQRCRTRSAGDGATGRHAQPSRLGADVAGARG
jgi:biopolymer transport protein ExbB